MIYFDTTAALPLLKAAKKDKTFGLIWRFLSVASSRQDLLSCKTCLTMLPTITAMGAEYRTYIAGPTFAGIVLLYVRAAEAGSEGRGKFVVSNAYNENQKVIHRDIVKLRNSSLAHFGVGEGRYGADWVQDRVMLAYADVAPSIEFHYSRRNYTAVLARDLMDLLDTAIPFAGNAFDERKNELVEHLSNAMISDSDVRGIIESCLAERASNRETEETLLALDPFGKVQETYTPRPDVLMVSKLHSSTELLSKIEFK